MPLSANTPAIKPIAYLTTAVSFLVLDGIWLALVSGPIYVPAIGHLMGSSVDWVAALLFYGLYVVGLVYFAVMPALRAARVRAALFKGAFLGLLAYGTYDLTNQATLRDWPWMLTMIDMAWGAVASGVASAMAAAVMLRITSGSAPGR